MDQMESGTAMTETEPFAGVVAQAAQPIVLDGPLGAVEVLPNSATAGQLSVVIHPLAARALGSPMHTHRDEDEYSFVLEGVVGVQIGATVYEAGPGDMICKPRGVPHAFWNPTDEPARLLEIITPGAFADYFRGLADVLATGGRDGVAMTALAQRFNLAIDASSIPGLVQQHALRPV
jgi:quercetin dioxygenase-like cupin family protein